ncbi:MAG: hypothetical protein K2J80_13615, partial [Oscillospiraceae bacterium]|nr:hypothetical protein [Oscillospiraceae bacterium]
SETGHALMLMTEGIRVHARDINEGNRKYKRFTAAGVLKLMDRSEISKVNFGDHISQDALILRFFIGDGFDMSERIDTVNEFIETTGGILLNYGSGRADICFTDENEYGRAADTAARLGFPSVILASYGKVEAGSAGGDKGAWLIALSNISDEFRKLDSIEKLELFGDPGIAPMICTKKAEDKLRNDRFFSRCDELRSNMLGDIEYFDIIPHELGEEDARETVNNNPVGDTAVDNSSLDPVS